MPPLRNPGAQAAGGPWGAGKGTALAQEHVLLDQGAGLEAGEKADISEFFLLYSKKYMSYGQITHLHKMCKDMSKVDYKAPLSFFHSKPGNNHFLLVISVLLFLLFYC